MEPTPYADVNALLADVLGGVPAALGGGRGPRAPPLPHRERMRRRVVILVMDVPRTVERAMHLDGCCCAHHGRGRPSALRT